MVVALRFSVMITRVPGLHKGHFARSLGGFHQIDKMAILFLIQLLSTIAALFLVVHA